MHSSDPDLASWERRHELMRWRCGVYGEKHADSLVGDMYTVNPGWTSEISQWRENRRHRRCCA